MLCGVIRLIAEGAKALLTGPWELPVPLSPQKVTICFPSKVKHLYYSAMQGESTRWCCLSSSYPLDSVFSIHNERSSSNKSTKAIASKRLLVHHQNEILRALTRTITHGGKGDTPFADWKTPHFSTYATICNNLRASWRRCPDYAPGWECSRKNLLQDIVGLSDRKTDPFNAKL